MTQTNDNIKSNEEPVHKPAANERVPGQGNSSDGLTRRLGADADSRGEKEVANLKKGEGNGEEERTREGSQGGSKGQKS